jgi:capsular exopolysaccharide synthesis family protein
MVPDASEDPAGASAVETAFRDRERGVMAESFRQIRSGLLKRMNQMDQKTLLIVSGMPGSGATSVISNLAYSFAAADRRVLVIDANLRRPAHHRIFGLPEAPGLADVLAGTHTLDNTVQRSADRRVDVLVAGTRENRVFERLSTDAMGAVLRRAREQYDLVLIDAAPMVVSGDALGLASRCDASLLVVRALSEKRGMVARLRNELAEAKAELLGILVNGVKSAAGGYLKGNIKATHDYQTKDAA